MDFKVIWSETAITDFKEICDYIATRNAVAALQVGRGVMDHVNLLGTFPFIGPAYPRSTNGTLREIVFRNYRIFYDVSEHDRKVEILHIRHGAREEPDF